MVPFLLEVLEVAMYEARNKASYTIIGIVFGIAIISFLSQV